jgi:ribA/ribD-fused uncharacterized protein
LLLLAVSSKSILSLSLQASKFNKEEGQHVRKWIQEATGPSEAMKIGKNYYKDPFKRKDFWEKNKEIMFQIVLSKFTFHPKQKRWLLDTDRENQSTPIFHVVEDDSFWGTGPLQQDGKYHGLNWNGKILMLVRKVLADSGRHDSLTVHASLSHNPFPCLVSDDEETRSIMTRNSALLSKAVGQFCGVNKPFPQGTLIAQRYRVLRHIKTGWYFR